jgi:hypothetical protein
VKHDAAAQASVDDAAMAGARGDGSGRTVLDAGVASVKEKGVWLGRTGVDRENGPWATRNEKEKRGPCRKIDGLEG